MSRYRVAQVRSASKAHCHVASQWMLCGALTDELCTLPRDGSVANMVTTSLTLFPYHPISSFKFCTNSSC